ncbi:MAG: SPASM domain-containing protein [Verrucomicrobia bacterium]|nr:SPASM domain-containing protein [Verrucomicrobiota bacterium]
MTRDLRVPVDTERPGALRAVARHYMANSAPRSPQAHLIETARGGHVFVADGSRLFDADDDLFGEIDAAMGEGAVGAVLDRAGLGGAPRIDDTPLSNPPLHALSLAIAQKCNLGCTYCYAQQGEFGGAAKNMTQETANQAVELLVSGAEPGARLNLAFLGGEPLVNRSALQAVTRHAAELAQRRGVTMTFSITTNGTLLTEADAVFFENFGFAVTVSLDGPAEAHDALRPYKSGKGSFDRVMNNVRPLLARQRRMQVAARVTVTPKNLMLRRTLDQFLAEGFHSVGFSPLLRAPTGHGEMQSADLELMLGEMIDCGGEFERRSRAGERYAFANMVNAMREIERGTHRPYPCGAGAGYLGVSADGDLAACHRFVGDEDGAMGNLVDGVDRQRRADWLAERHVHRQEPCRDCWARYLCGGGCHHEVIRRGRPACDYIRGWLHYCLEAYLRLSTEGVCPPGRRPVAATAAGAVR